MDRIDKGELSRYVRSKMKRKGLTQREVELRSGGKITDGYVADILSGVAKNPSVEKIVALAMGLDVEAHELFDVACGPFRGKAAEQPATESLHILPFLEMIMTVAENPDLIRMIEEIIHLLPEERKVMLSSLEMLNQHKVRRLASKPPLLPRKNA